MTIDTTTPAHPAPFNEQILTTIAAVLAERLPDRGVGARVLDPFAGVGGVHDLRALLPGVKTRGVELMPRWAHAHPGTIVGDATHLPRSWGDRFDAVVTSPCYGNRMADHHDAADRCSQCAGHGINPHDCPKCGGSGLSPRRSYRHYYGDGFWTDADERVNAGALHWGEPYRDLHTRAWGEVRRVLRPRGVFLLNVKDHIRGGERQRVADWHRRCCERLGFVRAETITIQTPGYRRGENHGERQPAEYVYVFTKP